MNSNRVKTYLFYYILWRWGYLGAATEGFNSSDVFAVRRNLYTVEFEIKLNRNDLKREVNIIKQIIKNKSIFGIRGSNTKVTKHGTYLGYWRFDRFIKEVIPNVFSFIVPRELEGIKEDLVNTPYGLYVVWETKNDWNIERIIKPKKLHKNKIRGEDLARFFRKLTTENYSLRKKIYLK